MVLEGRHQLTHRQRAFWGKRFEALQLGEVVLPGCSYSQLSALDPGNAALDEAMILDAGSCTEDLSANLLPCTPSTSREKGKSWMPDYLAKGLQLLLIKNLEHQPGCSTCAPRPRNGPCDFQQSTNPAVASPMEHSCPVTQQELKLLITFKLTCLQERCQAHRRYWALWSHLAEPWVDLHTSGREPPRTSRSSGTCFSGPSLPFLRIALHAPSNQVLAATTAHPHTEAPFHLPVRPCTGWKRFPTEALQTRLPAGHRRT